MRLNCDMAEIDISIDQKIMPLIDMANIACGLHASTPWMMNQVAQMAKHHNVSIGAHPSYDDREGFGRRKMDVTADELKALLNYQIGALVAICEGAGTTCDYVKPHGALYNTMMVKPEEMKVIMSVVSEWQDKLNKPLPLMVMASAPDHFVHQMACDYGLSLLFEAFCDRAYCSDGSLASRDQEGAVLKDEKAIQAHLEQLIREGQVTALDGTVIPLTVDTLCIHGDSPLALKTVEIARSLIGSYAN